MPNDELEMTRLDFVKATPRVWADILQNGDAVERLLVLTEIVLLAAIFLFATWGVAIAIF